MTQIYKLTCQEISSQFYPDTMDKPNHRRYNCKNGESAQGINLKAKYQFCLEFQHENNGNGSKVRQIKLHGNSQKSNGRKMEKVKKLGKSTVYSLRRSRISAIRRKKVAFKAQGIDEIKKLQNAFQLFLKDLVKFRMRASNLVLSAYHKYEDKSIIVNVPKGQLTKARSFIRGLPEYDRYRGYIVEREGNRGKFLTRSNCPVGVGSDIAVVEKSRIDLHSVMNALDDRSRISSHTLVKNHQAKLGTLTCICKWGDNYYGMTTQHIYSEELCDNTRDKHYTFSEVLYQGPEIIAEDVILLSEAHFGKLGRNSDETLDEKTVDIALLKLNQQTFDVSTLEEMPLFTSQQKDQLIGGLIMEVVTSHGYRSGSDNGVVFDDNYFYMGLSGLVFAVEGNGELVFSEEGESGTLVTKSHRGQDYALGIVSKSEGDVTLCVYLDQCFEALRPLIGCNQEPVLYKGFLKPSQMILRDQSQPFMK